MKLPKLPIQYLEEQDYLNCRLRYNQLRYDLYRDKNKPVGKCRISLLKPVIQYSLSNSYIKEYASAAEAGRILGLNRKFIGSCCRGERGHRTHGNYIWKFKNKY